LAILKKDNNPKSETEIKSHAKTIKNANEKFTIMVVNVKNTLVVACLSLLYLSILKGRKPSRIQKNIKPMARIDPL
jgi:hypothetical protein